MFGYVVANLEDATGPEKERYRAVYCGLCRALGRRCGQRCRLALTYDMAFLVLLLGSLYEPEETRSRARCVAHPLKAHDFVRNRFTDYAADVTVALAYHKCRDDWSDERKAAARVGQAVLAGAYRRVRERMPRQCAAIERELAAIDALEQAGEPAPDEAARCFGRCMGELFVTGQDPWAETLRNMGYHLGRFVYLVDAVCDLERDRQRGSYNPLAALDIEPADQEMALAVIMGQATAAFEKLPLEQDLHLLRNVLYSGVWQKYNVQFKKGAAPGAAGETSDAAKAGGAWRRPAGRQAPAEGAEGEASGIASDAAKAGGAGRPPANKQAPAGGAGRPPASKQDPAGGTPAPGRKGTVEEHERHDR